MIFIYLLSSRQKGDIMRILIALGLLMVVLLACSQETTRTPTEGQCADPRPEICTKEYMPVCGNNGQTYGNKCEACADQNVNTYEQGACNDPVLFSVRYAGAFTMPEWAQTIYKVEEGLFTVTRMTNDDEVTHSASRELSAEELGELQDILAAINNLEPNYTTDELVTDVGFAQWVVGDEETRVDPNIDEAYPASLLALRQWVAKQAELLPDEQGRIYQTRDTDICMRIKYACEPGMEPFSDDAGCGCKIASDPAGSTHPALTECGESQRGMACTMQYDPVCASVDTGIRCITTPCPSAEYKTYGNACSACSDEKVYGYFPGECGGFEGTIA